MFNSALLISSEALPQYLIELIQLSAADCAHYGIQEMPSKNSFYISQERTTFCLVLHICYSHKSQCLQGVSHHMEEPRQYDEWRKNKEEKGRIRSSWRNL